MCDLYLYISFYNIWKFGCLLWCQSINKQGSQKPGEKKKSLLEILKSKPEVIGLFYPTWFHILISPNHQLPQLSERLRFFAVANT